MVYSMIFLASLTYATNMKSVMFLWLVICLLQFYGLNTTFSASKLITLPEWFRILYMPQKVSDLIVNYNKTLFHWANADENGSLCLLQQEISWNLTLSENFAHAQKSKTIPTKVFNTVRHAKDGQKTYILYIFKVFQHVPRCKYMRWLVVNIEFKSMYYISWWFLRLNTEWLI